jgi:hypothetical protein
MKNKLYLIGIIGIVIIGIILVFLFSIPNNSKDNAENKIETNNSPVVVKDIKTVDDIKKVKEEGNYVSEFDKCIAQVEIDYNKYEKYLEECVQTKLISLGYSDGIDCIQDYNNPICESIDRYNAQVDADNDCMSDENLPKEIKNRITMMDCYVLIE